MAAEPIEPPVLLREESSAAAEAIKSVKVTLADLCAKGTSQYARKNYEAAADLYAQASEMQVCDITFDQLSRLTLCCRPNSMERQTLRMQRSCSYTADPFSKLVRPKVMS